MELLHSFIDLVLHLDRHLIALLGHYGGWLYGILFVVIFAETGLVVTPFLPGDSLLFAVGALTAVDTSGTLHLPLLLALLMFAAIAGNTVNYQIGRMVGQAAFSGRHRFFKQQHLHQTQDFFRRHGGLAVALSRFMPILRTFAPFVAGIGHMPWLRFVAFNVLGGVSWVGLMTLAGYLFGNLPIVRQNFGLVTIGIVIVSLLPLAYVTWRDRAGARRG
jgi:membrane-associated protein